MRLLTARLLDSREILPGQWLLRWEAPWLASTALPGQFVHVRMPEWAGMLLRRPYRLNTFDRIAGELTLHVRVAGRGSAWLTQLRPGESVEMLGPLGRGFEVDPRSRHLLLIAGGAGISGVRALADAAVAEGRQVTVLFGAARASEVYPASLLPDEVEYLVATQDGSLGHHGDVTELVGAYEAWADQAFAAGPPGLLAALARIAAGRDARLGVARLGRKRGANPDPLGSPGARRKSWLQVALQQTMGCAVGACLGCVVTGVLGPQRVCREGPVFAAAEIDWEAAG